MFRKDVTYDNIKIKKKQGLVLSLTFLEKPEEECQTEPPRPVF